MLAFLQFTSIPRFLNLRGPRKRLRYEIETCPPGSFRSLLGKVLHRGEISEKREEGEGEMGSSGSDPYFVGMINPWRFRDDEPPKMKR